MLGPLTERKRFPAPYTDPAPVAVGAAWLPGGGGLVTVLRGLSSRAATTIMILLVAIAAVASATAGPTYFAASKTSILRDTFSTGPVLGRGFAVTESGSVDDLLGETQPLVTAAAAPVRGTFLAPIQALEATAVEPHTQQTLGLVWRTGVCSHLQVRGSCPKAASQVIVSQSLASAEGWRIGQRLSLPGWGQLTITGIYAVPDSSADYWFDRGAYYFPFEMPQSSGRNLNPTSLDAMFTAESTLLDAPPSAQGTAVVDDVVDTGRLAPSEVGPLEDAMNQLTATSSLSQSPAIVVTDIPATVATVRSGWSSLEVPVLIITLQLWALSWLLLLVLVTEATAARSPEVALVKLRGYGGWRTVAFLLSEPLVLLAAALPAGAICGWGATILLGRARLRSGTPIGLPGLGWAAAAVATVGGITAVAIASRRALRMPVTDQWRLTGRRAAERGWIVDAVLLTGAAAGLLELWLSGTVTAAHKSPLSMLVPGLLGIAVAVVASRLLPWACRVLAGRAGRSGLGLFIAFRQIARRPGGARTTIILGASFALAAFGLSAFQVDQANFRSAAALDVGAPTVMTVDVPQGQQLSALVHQADPSGTMATPVVFYHGGSALTLAVDPTTWGRIATWPHGTTAADRRLLAAVDPPEPPPLTIDGDAVRVAISVSHLNLAGATLAMDVTTTDGTAPTPVSLGTLPAAGGTVTATGSLVSCPCQVQDFTVAPPPGEGGQPVGGEMELRSMQVQDQAGWSAVDAGFGQSGRWTSGDTVKPTAAGLGWSFQHSAGPATLSLVDRPMVLPAVVSTSIATQTGPLLAAGLNGQPLSVQVVGTVPGIPSAPQGAVAVDLQYAEIAAGGDLSVDVEQVWTTRAAAAVIGSRLKAEGVSVLSTATEAADVQSLQRQGPGLARVLFLAEAGVAAGLAAAGSVLGLYLLARRRRYELAALVATGVKRRSVLTVVAAEQLVVVAFGTAVGIGTGLGAAALVLGQVPEFQTPLPVGLVSFPPVGPLVAILVAGVAAVLAVALWASVRLVRGVRLDQLRETPV